MLRDYRFWVVFALVIVLALYVEFCTGGVVRGQSVVDRYDANSDRIIDKDEVTAAIGDYFDGVISKDWVTELVGYYFNGVPTPTTAPTATPGPRPSLPPSQVDFDPHQTMAAEAERALKALESRDPRLAEKLREAPWVTGGTNYPAMIALGHMSIFNEQYVVPINDHPALQDGISYRESVVLTTARNTAVESVDHTGQITSNATIRSLLDPQETDIELRSITLPLAGEVGLAIIRPFPSDACADPLTMDYIEESVRTIEHFMGAAFPMDPVVFLFDLNTTGGGERYGTYIRIGAGDSRECARGHGSRIGGVEEWLQLLAHEAAHHYWHFGEGDPPGWLVEGAAVFMAHVVSEKLDLPLGEIEHHYTQRANLPCTLVDSLSELEALPYTGFDYRDCMYVLGMLVLHDLHKNMDEVTFRQGFRRLYLATQGAIPQTRDCQRDIFRGHYGCVVKEAFQAHVPTDQWPAFEEVFTRHYGSLD